MFAQMKSSREPSKPCPCNNSCLCHKPQEDWVVWLVCGLGFVLLVSFPYIMYRIEHRNQIEENHIDVNGQDCIVGWKQDGVSSTGASYGHDKAVCPNK